MNRRSVVVAAALLVVAVPAASATNIVGASYTPFQVGSTSRVQSSWREANDSISFYTHGRWDTAHRNGIQQYAAQGFRYTQDFRDGSGVAPAQLNATGVYSTTFLNPKYDKDDDDGNRKSEEAEITADSTSFPTTNELYFAQVQFSRFANLCTKTCTWVYDPDGGEIGISSQISRWSALQGEWNTEHFSDEYRFVSYPVQARSAAASSPTPDEVVFSGSETPSFVPGHAHDRGHDSRRQLRRPQQQRGRPSRRPVRHRSRARMVGRGASLGFP